MMWCCPWAPGWGQHSRSMQPCLLEIARTTTSQADTEAGGAHTEGSATAGTGFACTPAWDPTCCHGLRQMRVVFDAGSRECAGAVGVLGNEGHVVPVADLVPVGRGGLGAHGHGGHTFHRGGFEVPDPDQVHDVVAGVLANHELCPSTHSVRTRPSLEAR